MQIVVVCGHAYHRNIGDGRKAAGARYLDAIEAIVVNIVILNHDVMRAVTDPDAGDGIVEDFIPAGVDVGRVIVDFDSVAVHRVVVLRFVPPAIQRVVGDLDVRASSQINLAAAAIGHTSRVMVKGIV